MPLQLDKDYFPQLTKVCKPGHKYLYKQSISDLLQSNNINKCLLRNHYLVHSQGHHLQQFLWHAWDVAILVERCSNSWDMRCTSNSWDMRCNNSCDIRCSNSCCKRLILVGSSNSGWLHWLSVRHTYISHPWRYPSEAKVRLDDCTYAWCMTNDREIMKLLFSTMAKSRTTWHDRRPTTTTTTVRVDDGSTVEQKQHSNLLYIISYHDSITMHPLPKNINKQAK